MVVFGCFYLVDSFFGGLIMHVVLVALEEIFDAFGCYRSLFLREVVGLSVFGPFLR